MLDKLKKGDSWYIKHSGGQSLLTRTIHEITEKTVVLYDSAKLSGKADRTRFLTSDIKFIEKVEEK